MGQTLAAAEARGESEDRTALPAARTAPQQPEDCPRLPSQGSLSTALGLQLALLGWQVPRRMVQPSRAVPYRAYEKDRPHLASASRTDPQLLPRSKATS